MNALARLMKGVRRTWGGIPLLVVLAMAAPARAFDPVNESPPQSWINALLPEKLPRLKMPEYFNPLDEARAQVNAGRYRRALYTLYRPAAELDPIAVAVVRAEALRTLGRSEEALAALSDEKVKDAPPAQIARAVTLAGAGRIDDAIALLRDFVKAHPDSIPGHFYLGWFSEQIGDLKTAQAQYGWFFDPPQRYLDKWQGQGPDAFTSAEDVTFIGRALDRHSLLTGAYRNNPALDNIILNMFVQAYDVIDRSYLSARLAAAEYCLSHDNEGGAKEELEAVLTVNPNHPQALRLMGEMALDDFNLPKTDAFIAALRTVDPQSVDADRLEADSLLRLRQPEQAAGLVRQVLDRHPKDLEALGLLAAASALRLDQPGVDAALGQADAIAPQSPVALTTLADRLHNAWQYPRAEKYYQAAIERAGWWAWPRHRLGALYAENGEEDKARATLDAAYALDPFNVATVNYSRLLDQMAAFQRKETEHFVIVFDAAADPVMPEYIGEVMESIYADVCADFQHEPGRKIIVEIFPTKDQFSVRTAGQPGVESFAAAFGPVIAACTPRAGGQTLGRYNWPRVLRHEFTHTINLSATDQRCPRWLTEGLATWEEKLPIRFQRMGPVMYDHAMKGTLFTIAQLPLRVSRPQGPNDGEMVYTQGAWLARYLDATYGRDSIVKLLDAFKSGKTEAQAIRAGIGISVPELEDGFATWMKEQLKGWGYDEQTSKKAKDLETEGEKLIQARQYDAALPVWQELSKIRPVEMLPHQRLAGIYLKLGQNDKAIEHLLVLQKNELKDNRYAKRIARLYREEGKLDDAAKIAMQAVYIDPYDVDAHELLAELYDQKGDETGLSRERRVLSELARWTAGQSQ